MKISNKGNNYNMLWHTYKSSENCQQKVNNNKGSLANYTNVNLFIDKEKKEKSANLGPSLPFYGMIKS